MIGMKIWRRRQLWLRQLSLCPTRALSVLRVFGGRLSSGGWLGLPQTGFLRRCQVVCLKEICCLEEVLVCGWLY